MSLTSDAEDSLKKKSWQTRYQFNCFNLGCIMVPMAGIGTMFSGFVIQRFRLSCVKTLKFCIALLMCSLLLSPMYLIYCDHDTLAGIESHYDIDVGRFRFFFQF